MRTMILISLLLISTGLFSQTNGSAYAKIGEHCPNFILQLDHYHKKKIRIKNLLGQNIIFDFFSKGCTACFASLPKINNLQKKFRGKVQFISIGDEEKGIDAMYEKYHAADNLIFPVAYSNKIFNYFVHSGVPVLVWINKQGVVKAISAGTDLDSANISDFIAGKDFRFYNHENTAELTRKKYNINIPFLTNGNGGNDTAYLYRSLLSPWNPSMPIIRYEIDDYVTRTFGGRYDLLGVSRPFLYLTAYMKRAGIAFDDSTYGIWSPELVLETRDSAEFKKHNMATGEGIYCYSLTMPNSVATPEKIQEMMQKDLYRFFGYTVNIESRKMLCWKLIASDSAKILLKTAGGEPLFKVSRIRFDMKNQTIRTLLGTIWSLNSAILPLIDCTGIDYNIDFTAEGALMNIPDIKNDLKKYGLDLILAEKEMKVIVIKDN